MKTRTVMIGPLPVGGGNPVRVQGMLKSPLSDSDGLLKEGRRLVEAGAELIRVAVPEIKDAAVFGVLEELGVPLIADCHFSSGIADAALDAGFVKIRVNPGNTPEDGIMSSFEKAASRGAAVRVGFNSGSCGAHGAEELAVLALKWDEKVLSAGFKNFLISIKSSSVKETVDANRFFAQHSETPLHIGVTATGPAVEGVVKSSAGLGSLLLDGVGDTVRVSLTAGSEEEVRTAVLLREIASGRKSGLEVISCPACSRSRINVEESLGELLSKLTDFDMKRQRSIAVMGCEVNGPGEAGNCDIGICGTRKGGLLIKNGKIIPGTSGDHMIDVLLEEFRKL